MGLDVGSLFAKLGLDSSEFKTGCEGAEHAAEGFKDAIMEVGAAIGVAFSVEKIVEFGKESVAEFAEAEKATALLTNAFKAAGIQSKETRDRAMEFAESTQKNSVYTREQAENSERLLVSLAHLTGAGLERATTAAMNLSSGLGIDLNAATLLVAKAAEGNTASLGRYGIQVHKTGDETKDFEQVLTSLESKFGGAAQAELDTYSGKMAQFEHSVKDLKEEVGKGLAPILETAARKWGVWIDQLSHALNLADEGSNKIDALRDTYDALEEVLAHDAAGYKNLTDMQKDMLAQELHMSRATLDSLSSFDALSGRIEILDDQYGLMLAKRDGDARAAEEEAVKHDKLAAAAEKEKRALLALQDVKLPEIYQAAKGSDADAFKAKLDEDTHAFAKMQSDMEKMRANKELVPQSMIDQLFILGGAVRDDSEALKAHQKEIEATKAAGDRLATSKVDDFFATLDTSGSKLEVRLREDERALSALHAQMLETAKANNGVFSDDQAEAARRYAAAIAADKQALKDFSNEAKTAKTDSSALANGLNEVGDSMFAVYTGAESANDAAKGLVKTLASSIIHALAAKAAAAVTAAWAESHGEVAAVHAATTAKIASTQAATSAAVAGNAAVTASYVEVASAAEIAIATQARLSILAYAAEGAAAAGAAAATLGPFAIAPAAAAAYAEIAAWEGAVPGFAEGGEVRGGRVGRDSVLAALTPGEVVLPTDLVQALKMFLAGGHRGGAGGGLTVNIGGAGHDSVAIRRMFRDEIYPEIIRLRRAGMVV